MDKTIQEVTDTVREFCEAHDWDQYHGPKGFASGIITEASELLEHFRFLSEVQALELFKTRKVKRISKMKLPMFSFFAALFTALRC